MFMHRNASTLTHREGNASTVDPEPARVQGSVCDLWRVEVEVPHARLVQPTRSPRPGLVRDKGCVSM